MRLPGKNKRPSLACPSTDGWELWSSEKDGVLRLAQRSESLDLLPLGESTVLALPARQVFATPLWITAAEQSLLPDMVSAQLEKRALLKGPGMEAAMDFSPVAVEDGQTLVLAATLPPLLPEVLVQPSAGSYDCSARIYPMPADHLVLWAEGAHLVMAATRGSELAYFQALSDGSFTPQVFNELRCTHLALEAQKITRIRGVILWADASTDTVEHLRGLLGQPVRIHPKPPPRLPARVWNLMPEAVRRERAGLREQGRRRKSLGLAILLAMLGAAAFAADAGWLKLKCWKLERALAANRARVAVLQETARRWGELEAAITPEASPLEHLLRCSSALPPEGVRFTHFEQQGYRIAITGEAKNAPAASKFEQSLKESKELAGYKWEMQQPSFLPNGTVKFHVEGVRPHASAQ